MSDTPAKTDTKTLLNAEAADENVAAMNERLTDQVTKALPATFVDTFYVEVAAKLTRITLGEYLENDQVYYRAAFVFPTESAVDLAKSILELFGKTEKDNYGGG